MKKILLLLVYSLALSCSKTNKDLYVNEFNWTLNIPINFEDVPSQTRIESQNKGKKMVESAYPENKVKIVARNLFHFKYGKYNSVQAQFSDLDEDEKFIDKFDQANEIVLKSFSKSRPNSSIENNNSKKIIDGLEFHVFNMNTSNDNGDRYRFTVYSRMFDHKKLDIIVLSNDIEKGKLFDKIILESKFN